MPRLLIPYIDQHQSDHLTVTLSRQNLNINEKPISKKYRTEEKVILRHS